jgi:hypothetical protein
VTIYGFPAPAGIALLSRPTLIVEQSYSRCGSTRSCDARRQRPTGYKRRMPPTTNAPPAAVIESAVAGKGLTHKRERFAQLVAAGFSQADAYRQSHDTTTTRPATAWVEGASIAAMPMVARRISELRASATAQATHGFAVSRARVIAEMYRMATYDPRQLLDADGRPLPLHELPDEIASAVEQVDVLVDADGRPTAYRYRLAKKAAHLEQTAKALGMFEEDNRQKSASLATALAELAGAPAARIGPAADGG